MKILLAPLFIISAVMCAILVTCWWLIFVIMYPFWDLGGYFFKEETGWNHYKGEFRKMLGGE